MPLPASLTEGIVVVAAVWWWRIVCIYSPIFRQNVQNRIQTIKHTRTKNKNDNTLVRKSWKNKQTNSKPYGATMVNDDRLRKWRRWCTLTIFLHSSREKREKERMSTRCNIQMRVLKQHYPLCMHTQIIVQVLCQRTEWNAYKEN